MPILREMPTDELQTWRELFQEQLTWGLSKQARKSTEIKLGAIDHVLRERGETPDDNQD